MSLVTSKVWKYSKDTPIDALRKLYIAAQGNSEKPDKTYLTIQVVEAAGNKAIQSFDFLMNDRVLADLISELQVVYNTMQQSIKGRL